MKQLYSALTLWAGFTAAAIAYANPTGSTPEFDWDTITPSHNLKYYDCYQDFRCARLLLPLDWLNEANEETVAIAITKLPAVVDDDDPSFGGTIFSQPGGPAVSGTDYARRMSQTLRDVIDIPGKKHYEMLSFDARGIGHSLPRIDCFPGISRYMWMFETITNGALDLSPASLAFAIAAAKADGHKCNMTNGGVLAYVGTPNVARDIVAMVDKIEQLRQENTKHREQVEHPHTPTRLELRSTGQPDVHDQPVPRLQYIGISYGTVIGNYFASMFPGRVGRMVLDGVMDAEENVHGLGWLTNTVDTDEIVDIFFRGCAAAGQSGCALCREQDTSGSDVSRRFWSWADDLNEHPLIIMTDDNTRLSLRTGDVRNLLLWAMYNAVYDSQSLAEDFDNAMRGNTTSLVGRIFDFNELESLESVSSNGSMRQLIPPDARSAVVCIDGDDVSSYDNSHWHDYLQQQLSVSSIAGAFWTTLRLACAGWTSRPNWVFKGPFKTPKPSRLAESPESGRPSAPLLFMSNRYDPVTPVPNARAMAKNHPGAGVIVQESIGHCVILGPMGPCVKRTLSEYFDTGVVPSEEVSCEPTRGPWDMETGTDG